MRDKSPSIAFVLGNLALGGAETQALELARMLPKYGHRAVLALAEKEGPLLEVANEYKIPVYDLEARHYLSRKSPAFWLNFANVIQRLRRVCVTENCQIIQSMLFWQAPIAVPAAKLTPGVQAVITSRLNEATFKDNKPHYQKIENLLNPFVDVVVCNSQGVRESTLKREKIDSSKIRVIHNGVNAERFATAKPVRIAEEFPTLADAQPLIISLGTLKREKRHDLFIRAIAAARSSYPGMKAIIVGRDAGLRDDLANLIEELELTNDVILTGPRTNPEEYLAASDILVLSSDTEGMPNAVLEGMAAGKAVISTQVAGAVDLIHHGESGLLVPIGDVQAITDALCQLAGNSALCADYGKKAQEFVRENLTIEKMVEGYANLYSSLLSPGTHL